jgi:cytochrome b6-f complex subunit 4
MAEPDISPDEKTIPFFPDHITTEAKVAVGILILTFIVGAIGLFAPVGLEAPADPMETPAHTRPEWYFLFLYQLLKYVPRVVGILIPAILLTIWPFLDRREDTRQAVRMRWAITIVILVFILVLTVLGFIT